MGNKVKDVPPLIFYLLIIVTLLIPYAASSNIIKSIPGFPGNLPFYLETGYVGVGENEQVQLFYYFSKSERNPDTDPLMLWLTGGPGCSALSGLVIEIGPLMFNTSACNWHSKAPTFQLNPSSWTKIASIIFLDSPVGTGFSYATNSEGYFSDDLTSSSHIYQFMRKWLMDHDGFINNPLYISGDSYCGKIVPIVVQEISNGNKAGFQPVMNLQCLPLEDYRVIPVREASRVKLEQTRDWVKRRDERKRPPPLTLELYDTLETRIGYEYVRLGEEVAKEFMIETYQDLGSTIPLSQVFGAYESVLQRHNIAGDQDVMATVGDRLVNSP